MSHVNLSPKNALEHEQSEILQQLEDWLEIPMLVLSFIWSALFVVELIWGLSPLLDALGITIWVLFVLDFGLKFLLAPRKLAYLKQNWLTVAVFGYVTATLATFFVGRDADNPEAEVAGAKEIAALQAEIAGLRSEIQTLLHRQQEK